MLIKSSGRVIRTAFSPVLSQFVPGEERQEEEKTEMEPCIFASVPFIQNN
jgi:hypothetical protein